MKIRFLVLVLCVALSGCATPLRKSISSIPPEALEEQGMIVGHIKLYSVKGKAELGGLFGMNYMAYATRVKGGDKKVYDLLVTNKDDGYFAWPMEPGTYWIHHCRVDDVSGEVSLGEWSSFVEVKSGEITYIGDLDITIGKTSLKKTLQKTFDSGVVENLKNMTSLLIEVEQKVSDAQLKMKEYLNKTGFKNKKMNTSLVKSWKYVP